MMKKVKVIKRDEANDKRVSTKPRRQVLLDQKSRLVTKLRQIERELQAQ